MSATPSGGARSSLDPHAGPARVTSRSSSRVKHSRAASVEAAFHYAASPENFVLPEGQVSEETVEGLQELIHPHHETEETLLGEEEEEEEENMDHRKLLEERKKLPWYKRPSPWWFLTAVGLSGFVVAATMAPRIEMYTQLACEVHKPDYTLGGGDVNASFSGIEDPNERKRLCAADPEVGAAVATLTLVYTSSMGVLGCLTTAWWSSLSDRAGRIRVLGIVVCGVLFADANFVSVAKLSKVLPGSYWWFVMGALVEGIFGSVSTLNAIIHAYVADTVQPHERAHFFSLIHGLMFCGFALGPTVGGLIVRYTGTPLSVFYMSISVHTIFSFFFWFIVPESLTAAQKKESLLQYQASVAKGKRDAIDAPILYRFKQLFSFLSPLTVLWQPGEDDSGNPLKARKTDWSLPILAASSASALLLMGSYTYKFQYTSSVFGWTSEQIGYWLSIIGFVRASYLTLILPVIIKLFKPKSPQPVRLETNQDESLQPNSTDPSRSPSPIGIQRSRSPASALPSPQSLSFDLNLARASVFIEFISMLTLPFARSPLVFTVFSIITCFGSGHAPAAQSVALALYAHRGGVESGKLLGALGVLQVVCSQILGPAIFGMTYVKTVATFPAMIFYISAIVLGTAFFLLLFVRVPKPDPSVDVEEPLLSTPTGDEGHAQDETLVDIEVPVIVVDAASPKVASSRD